MKKTKTLERTKWENIFEDDETIATWKYDSKISKINPYCVEIKYKKPPKQPIEVKTKKGK